MQKYRLLHIHIIASSTRLSRKKKKVCLQRTLVRPPTCNKPAVVFIKNSRDPLPLDPFEANEPTQLGINTKHRIAVAVAVEL